MSQSTILGGSRQDMFRRPKLAKMFRKLETKVQSVFLSVMGSWALSSLFCRLLLPTLTTPPRGGSRASGASPGGSEVTSWSSGSPLPPPQICALISCWCPRSSSNLTTGRSVRDMAAETQSLPLERESHQSGEEGHTAHINNLF